MTLYNVHIYREMRLRFDTVEAESPEAAAAIARERTAEEAATVAECDGIDLAALVDEVGDEAYERSVTIDFARETPSGSGILDRIVVISVRGGVIEDIEATAPLTVVVEDWDVHDQDTGERPLRIVLPLAGELTKQRAATLAPSPTIPPATERNRPMKQLDTILTDIAREHLGIETLDTRKSDRLDFHDLAVWCLKDALNAAFEAGAAHPSPHPAQAEGLPARFDDYEIGPCLRFEEPDSPGHLTFEPCEPHEADVWTLYGHVSGEGVHAIGDFATREHAEEVFARITGRPYAAQPLTAGC